MLFFRSTTGCMAVFKRCHSLSKLDRHLLSKCHCYSCQDFKKWKKKKKNTSSFPRIAISNNNYQVFTSAPPPLFKKQSPLHRVANIAAHCMHHSAASNVLVWQVSESNSKLGYNEQVLQCNSENSCNEGKGFGTEKGHYLKSGTSTAIVGTSKETTVMPVKIQYWQWERNYISREGCMYIA